MACRIICHPGRPLAPPTLPRVLCPMAWSMCGLPSVAALSTATPLLWARPCASRSPPTACRTVRCSSVVLRWSIVALPCYHLAGRGGTSSLAGQRLRFISFPLSLSSSLTRGSPPAPSRPALCGLHTTLAAHAASADMAAVHDRHVCARKHVTPMMMTKGSKICRRLAPPPADTWVPARCCGAAACTHHSSAARLLRLHTAPTSVEAAAAGSAGTSRQWSRQPCLGSACPMNILLIS